MIVLSTQLIGGPLNWAVMRSEGENSFAAEVYYEGDLPVSVDDQPDVPSNWEPSVDWSQGGPIIEQHGIRLHRSHSGQWWASPEDDPHHPVSGPTPLVAAMRCYVISQMGHEVDVPEHFL